mmetsp:Transcript_42460/g.99442  ORF Transcript_42460/g.99442 Transcript_42460/m.99442 type:complete len:268 (+) Transcript_42460:214-1017(+)
MYSTRRPFGSFQLSNIMRPPASRLGNTTARAFSQSAKPSTSKTPEPHVLTSMRGALGALLAVPPKDATRATRCSRMRDGLRRENTREHEQLHTHLWTSWRGSFRHVCGCDEVEWRSDSLPNRLARTHFPRSNTSLTIQQAVKSLRVAHVIWVEVAAVEGGPPVPERRSVLVGRERRWAEAVHLRCVARGIVVHIRRSVQRTAEALCRAPLLRITVGEGARLLVQLVQLVELVLQVVLDAARLVAQNLPRGGNTSEHGARPSLRLFGR